MCKVVTFQWISSRAPPQWKMAKWQISKISNWQHIARSQDWYNTGYELWCTVNTNPNYHTNELHCTIHWWRALKSNLVYNALCVLCSVGSSVLKNALYLIQSDRLSLSIIYRAIHFDQWDSSVSTTVSNSELSDCSVSTTELSDRSCIWYWVAFGRKFQF